MRDQSLVKAVGIPVLFISIRAPWSRRSICGIFYILYNMRPFANTRLTLSFFLSLSLYSPLSSSSSPTNSILTENFIPLRLFILFTQPQLRTPFPIHFQSSFLFFRLFYFLYHFIYVYSLFFFFLSFFLLHTVIHTYFYIPSEIGSIEDHSLQ